MKRSLSPGQFFITVLIGAVVVLTGSATVRPGGLSASVVVDSRPLSIDSRQCAGSFMPHRLPHVTRSYKERSG